MEFSERCIQTLEKAGFSTISEQTGLADGSATFLALLTPATLMVTDGTLSVVFGATIHRMQVGDSLIIPAFLPYVLTAGRAGFHIVLGEN